MLRKPRGSHKVSYIREHISVLKLIRQSLLSNIFVYINDNSKYLSYRTEQS